jgi:hypothetical protein
VLCRIPEERLTMMKLKKKYKSYANAYFLLFSALATDNNALAVR